MRRTPAYELRTDRLVVRCYDPRDAPAVHEVILRNRAHLVPFMGWALSEPSSLADRVSLLRSFRGRFDLDDNYFYGIFLPEGPYVGSTGLHPRGSSDDLEIGYWIDERFERRGFITEAVAALAKHALVDLALTHVEIRCDPRNVASNRVAEKLGFTREATLRKRYVYAPNQPRRDLVIWSLLREDLPRAERVNWARYQAFDATGAPCSP